MASSFLCSRPISPHTSFFPLFLAALIMYYAVSHLSILRLLEMPQGSRIPYPGRGRAGAWLMRKCTILWTREVEMGQLNCDKRFGANLCQSHKRELGLWAMLRLRRNLSEHPCLWIRRYDEQTSTKQFQISDLKHLREKANETYVGNYFEKFVRSSSFCEWATPNNINIAITVIRKPRP